jgi:threonine-phosphate decarboxylase
MMNKKSSIPAHGGDVYSEGLYQGKDLIDFSSNINPLGVPKSFINNYGEALNSITRYPDIEYRELIKNLCKYVGKQQDIKVDNFVLGNGASEIIDLVISTLGRLLIIVPSFGEYEADAKKWGCNIEYSYLKDDMSYDYEDIYSKLNQVDGLIIGNPNNPSGNIIDKVKFNNIFKYCEKNNKIVVIDEAFIEFTSTMDLSFTEEIKNFNCLFIIRALTKFFGMPGIRFGYGISKNLDLLRKIKEKQNPWNINCFAEVACKYVLEDEDYIEDSKKWIYEEKGFLPKSLKKISFIERVYPTECNYILCKLKHINGDWLYRKCMEQGILIRRASNFKGLDNRYIRFAIKNRELNMKLIEALTRIESMAKDIEVNK